MVPAQRAGCAMLSISLSLVGTIYHGSSAFHINSGFSSFKMNPHTLANQLVSMKSQGGSQNLSLLIAHFPLLSLWYGRRLIILNAQALNNDISVLTPNAHKI